MLQGLFVALGGAIGSATRYLVGGWFAARFGAAFPYGTFVINVTGSFFVGLFLAYAQERVSLSPYWRLFFAVGFVGGYTTFSTFSLETVLLIERNAYGAALTYVVGSVAAGVLGLWAALFLMRSL